MLKPEATSLVLFKLAEHPVDIPWLVLVDWLVGWLVGRNPHNAYHPCMVYLQLVDFYGKCR